MTYITEFESAIATRIHADELTQGDIIPHLDSRIQLISEIQYTKRGIMFESLWLDVDSTSNTHWLCFHNNSLFELVSQMPVFDTRLAA